MRYFDGRDIEINVKPIMASGALPPAFPAVRIDDELYWDGGILSNTPTEAISDGDNVAFTSFRAGTSYLNLIAQPAERSWSWWGRVIFYHSDVDGLYSSAVAAGYRPDTAPRDA